MTAQRVKKLTVISISVLLIYGIAHLFFYDTTAYGAEDSRESAIAATSGPLKEVDHFMLTKLLEDLKYEKMTSPHKDKILYHMIPADADDGMLDIFVMNVDGSNANNMTRSPHTREIGAWSKEGKVIYKEYAWKGMNGWDVVGWQPVKCFIAEPDGSDKEEISDKRFDELLHSALAE